MIKRAAATVGVCLSVLGACDDGTNPERTGASIVVVSGGGVTDTIAVALPAPLVVEVRGPDGNVAPGVEVLFISGPDSTAVPLVFIRRSSLTEYAAVAHGTTDGSGRTSVRLFTDYTAGRTEITVRAPTLAVETSASVTVQPGGPARVTVRPRDSLLFVNRSYRLEAGLVDRGGNAVVGTSTFASGSPAVQVSADGTVQAKGIGRAKIAVQIGGFADSAFTSVVPDGAIALYSFGSVLGESTGFAQVNLDGSAFKWIARTGTTGSEYAPANPVARWIPGTRQLVYPRTAGGGPRLFVGDSTESARRLIDEAYSVLWETDPEISSDGRWIYFVARDSVGAEAIWRVQSTGVAPERLTTEADGFRFGWPSLSPDGTRLAYVATQSSSERYRAYIRDLASNVSRPLGTDQAAGTLWSPTGEWILYTGYAGAFRIVRPDGTDDHLLVNGAAYLAGGTWSPDGKYIIGARGDIEGSGPYDIIELIDVQAGTYIRLPYPSGWYGPVWHR